MVPLCLKPQLTEAHRRYLRETHPVVWWATEVEVASAIRRHFRERIGEAEGEAWAMARLRELRQGWQEISPSDEVRRLAWD